MKKRLTIAIPLIAISATLLIALPLGFKILIALIALRAQYELLLMYKNKEHPSFLFRQLFVSAIFLWCELFTDWMTPERELGGILACLGMLFIFQILDRDNHRGMEKISLSIFSFLYVVIPGVFIFKVIDLSNEQNPSLGAWLIFFILTSSKLGDATALFGGMKFGKKKLLPRISPNKSWEGFYCGLLGSLLPAPFMAGITGIDLFHCLAMMLLVGLASVIGDLVESMLKREMDTKDVSTDIPGFGGFMDIIDAIVFAVPIAYFYLNGCLQINSQL